MTATNICYNFVGFRYSPPLSTKIIISSYGILSSKISTLIKGDGHLKPPKFEHICSCHNFFPLSSVQILF